MSNAATVTPHESKMNRSSTSLPVCLFVLPWSLQHLGGVNQVVINLARQMASQGSFEPVVLVTDWDAPEPVWETVHGLRTVRWRVRGPQAGGNLKQRIASFVWRRRFAPAFKAFCRDHKVSVINSHYPTEAALTLDVMCRTFVPTPKTIVSFHGADVTALQASSPVILDTWREFLNRAHGVVVCSSALGRRVQQTFDIVPTVIHNGIDSAAFIDMAGLPSLAPRRILLSVGKFEAKKGQDVLVRAFAAINDDYADLDLMLVGATDKTLQPLRQLCVQLGIQHRVHFRPDMQHHDVARCFARASIFALPSRQEPFGIVLLEAGCMALPVVASAVGGVPEILEDGVTGRLVQPDEPDELALALRALLDDAESARAMGERLRAHVVRNFAWTNAHDLYVRLVRT